MSDKGFLWSPRYVSFGALQNGSSHVEVILADEIVLRPDAIRAIKVPFTVGPTSLVEVATMIDNAQCRMQEGTYSLIFEMGRTDYDDLWCYFVFLPDTNPTAEILRADADLAP